MTTHPTRPAVLVLLALLALSEIASVASDAHGSQFISFKHIASFKKSVVKPSGDITLISPEISSRIHWDEVLLSWNVELPPGALSKLEVRAIYAGRVTRFYTMGLWSGDVKVQPRQSVPGQQDADGDVATDTLRLLSPCQKLQIRVTLSGEGKERAKVKFLSVCLTDTKANAAPLAAHRAAWGKTLPVPERSQMWYPDGKTLCSPTTVSMILGYWSEKRKLPELDREVPEIVPEIYDPNWHGTGNWPFNTAYAGAFSGMRAYVTRFSDVSELEQFIARGLPIGLSVCYNKLRGREGPPSGHLVVCVGFSEKGDVIVNDPGTSQGVRKTFPRRNLMAAWAHSHNAVYLIYPEKFRLPRDRFGHWDR